MRGVFYPGTALSTRVDVCKRSGSRAAAAEDGEMPCWELNLSGMAGVKDLYTKYTKMR